MLQVRGLLRRYGELVAVDGASFVVPQGTIVGLVGRNGAGKTTTMRSIMGLLRPDAGDIRWDGRPVDRSLQARFGYLPEERGLYPQMPVGAQVRYFARLHGLSRPAAAAAAHSWLTRLDLGARQSDRLVALSHGNQQRVQLAVALAHDPPLLVLDEPFAGLDPTAVDELSAVLRERAAGGAAVLFSSHQLDLVERLCERVVVLERGRVLAAGTLPELRDLLPRRLRVQVAAAPGWAAGLPGLEPVAGGSDGALFTLASTADPQRVLAAAVAAGPVAHFGFESAGLVDVYRDLLRRGGQPPASEPPDGRPAAGLPTSEPPGGGPASAAAGRPGDAERPDPSSRPPGGSGRQPLRTAALVAGRELSERLRGRAYWLLSALTVAMVVLSIVVPALVRATPAPTRIGLVGSTYRTLGPTLEQVARAARVPVRLSRVGTAGAARDALTTKRLDVAVGTRGGTTVVAVDTSLDGSVRAVLQAALDRDHQARVLRAAGVTAAAVGRALTPQRLATVVLHPVPADRGARAVAAIVAAILLWVAIGIYGGLIANGVAQEKTSRTVEVLLAALRPRQLLVGKVAGIGACGLIQMTLAIGGGLVANAVVHQAQIPGTVWVLLPMVLLWFLLGYALYALVYAAAGALVSRQEEVQLVTAPFGVFLIAGYLLVYASIANPDAVWVQVVSFLPPLAPVLMPARIALGHVPAWQSGLAVLVMLAAVAAMAELGARVYTGAVLRGGPRLGWRAALHLRS